MKRTGFYAVLVSVLFLAGCSGYSDRDFYGGRRVGQDELDALYSMVAAADTDRYPVQTDGSGDVIYFWTGNGTAMHKSRSCQSLSASTEVFSGTEDEALAAGKEKYCMICGK